ERTVGVIWNSNNPSYDKNEAGEYAFDGTLILPEDVTNPNEIMANIIVKVLPDESEEQNDPPVVEEVVVEDEDKDTDEEEPEAPVADKKSSSNTDKLPNT
ncbi:Ig-like domain-containing protein, partial [Pseudomonas sp. 2822-15]|uniref:Ig-like domain-containing protein n=1 Tax=Pseudomonas sp. 2822-15 TaxID=1712677 RepID=UPI0015B02D17